VAELCGLPPHRVRTLARAAGLEAQAQAGLGFQDVVLLRSLAGLLAARISPRRVAGALAGLRGRVAGPLSGVMLAAHGSQVVARDDGGLYDPASGQGVLDFTPPPPVPEAEVTPLRRPAPPAGEPPVPRDEPDAWYERGLAVEEESPAAAADMYRRALELEPMHAEAHINLGRLLHEAGELGAAEAHYRAALVARPGDATARFNLGVVLDDAGRADDAVAAYRAALEADPDAADAHFNLARLYESFGDKLAALRHLARYRQLTRG
jgi:hypothetical protein